MLTKWFKSGAPWIWLNAGAVSASLIMVFGLLALIAVRGLSHFWPADVIEWTVQEAQGQTSTVIGEVWSAEEVLASTLREAGFEIGSEQLQINRYLLKVGNRDVYGSDFRLVLQPQIRSERRPEDLVVIERREWGNAYGRLQQLVSDGKVIAEADRVWEALQPRLFEALRIHEEIRRIEKYDIGKINYGLEKLRLQRRRLELDEQWNNHEEQQWSATKAEFEAEYKGLQQQLTAHYTEINRDSLKLITMDGRELLIPLAKVVQIYRPNGMNFFNKLLLYFKNLWSFFAGEPREANTEGGVFPAIFGTIMMVLIMSVMVTPLGVVAAVYLREYARQGPLIRTIRIAVNNLAGVPSIVYGVFGLGFFVYFLGGRLDKIFFPEAAPAPVFGTPGILWSSLTLAILTLPVVIVATEEGLSRIPRSIREGSLALGATQFETLWRTVIPMASPAIMTGLILAIARAAGEVAPLMLVGVVKLAPSLPMDGNFPFVHLERKFMHLGFHIYDVGFQSPNVEAARPLVYSTALLLVMVIVVLNLAAIAIRNRLREKYRALET